jgi:hypothetical protein
VVNGPNLVFRGVNVHIENGPNGTGLGNLIIGTDPPSESYQNGDRQGSENLILGTRNRWSQNTSGAIVSGQENYVDGPWNAIIAGYDCDLIGSGSVMISGWSNVINGGGQIVMLTGQNNGAKTEFGVVIGGTNVSPPNNGDITLGGFENQNDSIFSRGGVISLPTAPTPAPTN